MIYFRQHGLPSDRANSRIITLGLSQKTMSSITQRKCANKLPFYSEIMKILGTLPKPFYSYNISFERNNEIGTGIICLSDFVDLMDLWKEKAESKGMQWPSLDDLVSEPEDYFHEFKTTGENVPRAWKRYVRSGFKFEAPVRGIMDHCFSDILRESILLLRYQPRQIVKMK